MEPTRGEVNAEFHAAVEQALGLPVRAVQAVIREPLEYDAFLAHRELNRVSGTGVVDGGVLPWTLIEKRTEGRHLASAYVLENGTREFRAYSSGLFGDIAPGIRTPRLYGSMLDPDGGITLWLEEIHHVGPRPLDSEAILAAARDLGGLSGRWLGRVPEEPWFFSAWIERHAQPQAVRGGLAALRRRNPLALALLGGRLALTEQLVLSQSRVRDVLESLPHTLCHHDAVGANVFRTAHQTALIDWESLGPGAVGADLASLLFSSVRRGDASVTTVAPLVDEAIQEYAQGMWAEGGSVELTTLRRGFDAAVALRWKLAVDVVTGIETGEAPRRGSMPDEAPADAVDELVQLVDVLLASAARTLDA